MAFCIFRGIFFQMKYLPIRLNIHLPFLMLISDSEKFHYLIGELYINNDSLFLIIFL